MMSTNSNQEPFFTEKDYERYSSLPSTIEYLQTYLTKKDKLDPEREKSEQRQLEITAKEYGINDAKDSEAAKDPRISDILKQINRSAQIDSGLCIEYPRLSALSVEEHSTFVEEFEKTQRNVPLDESKLDWLKEMKVKVQVEQQEFQHFVYQCTRKGFEQYNEIPSEVKEMLQIIPDERKIKAFPQYYNLHQTIGLSVGANFRSDPVLSFQNILQQVGDVPVLEEPTERVKLAFDCELNTQEEQHVAIQENVLLSGDPVAHRLAKKHDVQVVASSCCLQMLVDNQQPQFNQQWDIPVIVTQLQQDDTAQNDGKKVVFLEKPFPKKVFTPNQAIRKAYKRTLVRKLRKKNHLKTKNFVYSLWNFGKFRILIRGKLDAYENRTNQQSFLSVVAKPEYQSHFGYERFTASETARWWLKSFIRPNTTVMCARVNTGNHEILRVDKLTPVDVLAAGSIFNPAQGMKILYQILFVLAQISSDSYLLSHERDAIHCCLYKQTEQSLQAKKPELDLYAKFSKPAEVVNFGPADVPWAGIDSELFLAEHIEQRKIPTTFPAVSEKLLKELQHRKQTFVKKKKKKKKNKNQQRVQTVEQQTSEQHSGNPFTAAKLFPQGNKIKRSFDGKRKVLKRGQNMWNYRDLDHQ